MFSKREAKFSEWKVAAEARGAMTMFGVLSGVAWAWLDVWGKSLLTLLLVESMHDVLSAAYSRRGVCMS
jgi:hypothetical protein